MNNYDVIVIGAGPAGMTAGIKAGEKRKKTLIIEKNNSAGKKLLTTGGGHCNISHVGNTQEYLKKYGENGKFLKPALLNFSNKDLDTFFRNLGIGLVEDENGKLFPETKDARDVLNTLLTKCKSEGVKISYNESVTGIEKTAEEHFRVITDKSEYQSKTVIITTGGKSYPTTGSTGDGYGLAKKLGHKITPIKPALSPVYIKENPLGDLSGLSFNNVLITLWRDGKKIDDYQGELLITHKGLSGPAVLNFSSKILPGDKVRINFVNVAQIDKFAKDFMERINKNGKDTVKKLLTQYDLPKRLISKILELEDVEEQVSVAGLKKDKRKAIIKRMTEFPLEVTSLGGFNIAMATKGGVHLKEINHKTMESRICKGLYFAGEVVDIDGETGGYNLQAAFSMAILASQNIP